MIGIALCHLSAQSWQYRTEGSLKPELCRALEGSLQCTVQYDDKYPARPRFEPGTSSIQAPVDMNEPSGQAKQMLYYCWYPSKQETLPQRCLLLAHRLRRCPNSKPTLGQRPIFADMGPNNKRSYYRYDD